MEKEKRSCGTCNHCRNRECHRNPPYATLMEQHTECHLTKLVVETFWPKVEPSNICGEWAPIEPSKD